MKLAAAAGFVAFCGALAITGGYGPGLDPDSMAYVGAATSFAQHGTLRVPSSRWESPDSSVALTIWPPAFSMAMAVPQRIGAAPLLSARIVLACSALVTAAVIFILLSSAVGIVAAVAGVIAVLVTPAIVGVHISVLSEPLFFATLMLTLLGMVRHRPLPAGIAAAAALMTRYAGAGAGLAVAVWFFFALPGGFAARLRRAAIAAAPSGVAMAGWIIHNSQVGTTQASIRLSYYPGLGRTLAQGARTLASWLAPGPANAWSFVVAGAGATALAIAATIAFKRFGSSGWKDRGSAVILLRATSVLLACYLLVLVCSRLFVGGNIQLDARILSPAIVLAEITAIIALSLVIQRSRTPLRLGYIALISVWLLACVYADIPVIADAVGDGNDFAASDWRNSETLRWVGTEGRARTLYTNWPAAIYFVAGRAAHDIPKSSEPDTLRLFEKVLTASNGAFVSFNAHNPDYPPSDSIARAIGLLPLKRFADGTVWIPLDRSASNPFER